MYILSAVEPSTGIAVQLAGFSNFDAAKSAEWELKQHSLLNPTVKVVYGGVSVDPRYLRIDYVPEWEDAKVGV